MPFGQYLDDRRRSPCPWTLSSATRRVSIKQLLRCHRTSASGRTRLPPGPESFRLVAGWMLRSGHCGSCVHVASVVWGEPAPLDLRIEVRGYDRWQRRVAGLLDCLRLGGSLNKSKSIGSHMPWHTQIDVQIHFKYVVWWAGPARFDRFRFRC